MESKIRRQRWQQIEGIYHAARERDKSARAEYLAKACAGDDGLRREVESLLVQADNDQSFLEKPAIEMIAGAFAAEGSLSDQMSPAIARRFKKFPNPRTVARASIFLAGGARGRVDVRKVITRKLFLQAAGIGKIVAQGQPTHQRAETILR